MAMFARGIDLIQAPIRLLRRTRLSPTRVNALAAIHAYLAARPRATGSFDFNVHPVGSSGWTGSDGSPVRVYVENTLGAAADAMARSLIPRIDQVMQSCDLWFGVRGMGGNVLIVPLSGLTDGSGGAYHYGCSFGPPPGGGDWYCDYAAMNPDEVLGLVMAEVCESYMGIQSAGWNCGGSGGEALSRVLAEQVSGGPTGALAPYATAPSWDGSNWIDADQGTDQDYPSIGCGVLYLYWMLSQGYTISRIVQSITPDGTLSAHWSQLTGRPWRECWPAFQSAVAAVGGIGGITTDNPWASSPSARRPATPWSNPMISGVTLSVGSVLMFPLPIPLDLTSSDPSILSVSLGRDGATLTGVSVGDATLTLQIYSDLSTSLTVHVVSVPSPAPAAHAAGAKK